MSRIRNRRLPFAMLFCLATACHAEGRSESNVGERASSEKAARTLAAPRYFASGERNPDLLELIRETIDDQITFASHYSTVFTACGTACGNFWFVDRRTGVVIAAPDESGDGQMLSDVKTDARSNLVEVIYGPPGGFEEPGCAKQSFRWTGHEFEENSPSIPIKCPW